MLKHPTLDQFHALGLHGMAKAFVEISAASEADGLAPRAAPWRSFCGQARHPPGKEVRGHLRRIIRRIRTHRPATKITIRGDSHYGRREVMEWCEDNGLDYVYGLTCTSAT